MTRSQRIKSIVKLKQNRERHAAKEFAATQSALASIRQRLQQMLGYRQEYLQMFGTRQEKISIKQMREQQAFILQLDEGIRMLNEQIRIQEKMNNQERQNWLNQKQQLDTMQNIFERCVQTEQQLQLLREQNSLDDLSQAQIARR